MAADPARDCPPCPKCDGSFGTPISLETGKDPSERRWYGPDDATIWCPACGAGWVGNDADLAQAWASWRAYEAEIAIKPNAGA